MKACVECGNAFEADHDLTTICSPACKRQRNRRQVRASYEKARGLVDAPPRLCLHCGTTITDTQRQRYCSAACQDEGRLARYRERYAQTKAARGEKPKPAADAERVRRAELDGHKRCARAGCLRFVRPKIHICPDHMPRFDHEPKHRPRRATLAELEHYTYGGTSIAAQMSETRSEAWAVRQRRAGGGR